MRVNGLQMPGALGRALNAWHLFFFAAFSGMLMNRQALPSYQRNRSVGIHECTLQAQTSSVFTDAVVEKAMFPHPVVGFNFCSDGLVIIGYHKGFPISAGDQPFFQDFPVLF
jgi:hypothetical protein